MAGKHSKNNNTFLFIVLLACLALLLYSSIQIFNWLKDTYAIKNEMSDINEVVTITETTEVETAVIEPKEEKSSPYWDYIKINLIDVDFTELKDIKGWIQVNGTL